MNTIVVSDEIKKAELEKIKSQIDLERTQQKKILFEIDQAKKNGFYYQHEPLIKTLLWAIITSGLFIAWFVVYFSPIMSVETKKNKKENEYISLKNKMDALEITAENLKLASDNKSIYSQRQQLVADNKMLKENNTMVVRNLHFVNNYINDLINDSSGFVDSPSIDPEIKESFAKNISTMQVMYKEIDKQIVRLSNNEVEIQNQIEFLSKQSLVGEWLFSRTEVLPLHGDSANYTISLNDSKEIEIHYPQHNAKISNINYSGGVLTFVERDDIGSYTYKLRSTDPNLLSGEIINHGMGDEVSRLYFIRR